MEIGVDSFAAMFTDKSFSSVSDADAMSQLLQRIEHADQVGLDVFGIGEHHRKGFLDSAPTLILAAAAARTKRIRLTSAVTVLSAADPVRVFQNFATLDLISHGRAEMVVGRGSSIEAFPLFGFDLQDYDELFAEKLELLLNIRENEFVTWRGKFRPSINNLPVYPRPLQNPFPIWQGVGGTPESFVRAGTLGLPLMVAIIGGETYRFRPLVDLYREAGKRAGFKPDELKVGTALTWLCSRNDGASNRRILSRLCSDYDEGWQRTWLAAHDKKPLRGSDRTRRCIAGWQCRRSGGKDSSSCRSAWRYFQAYVSDG